jgi:hypothetical protein
MPRSLRIGFFLDGYTLKKVNDYYRNFHRFHSAIDFKSLRVWVEMQAIRYFEGENFRELEMESHYYHPYRNPHLNEVEREGTLRLEQQLIAAGYTVHFNKRPVFDGIGPNMSLMEDALLFAMYRKMDAIVLLSTQGEYAPLPDRLRLMGIPTLLLGWNFIYPKPKHNVHWKTDSYLRRTCAHYVAMEKVVDRGNSENASRGFFFQPARKT